MNQMTFAPAGSTVNEDANAFLSQRAGADIETRERAADPFPDLDRAANRQGWKAADFMTRDVLTIPAQGTLRQAAEIFALYDISGAPVLDEHGRLVGILSESDLISEAQRYADIPRLAVFGFHLIPSDRLWAAYRHSWGMEVANLMTRRMVTAAPDTPLTELAQIMATQDVNRIPIVENHRLVGIITRADILRAFASPPSSELNKEAWKPPKGLRQPGQINFHNVGDAERGESESGETVATRERVNEFQESDKRPTRYDAGEFLREANCYDGSARVRGAKPSWVEPGDG